MINLRYSFSPFHLQNPNTSRENWFKNLFPTLHFSIFNFLFAEHGIQIFLHFPLQQICVAYDWRKINGGVNCTETKKKNDPNRQNSFRACLCLVITMWQKRLSVLSENSLSRKRQADVCDAQFGYVLKWRYRYHEISFFKEKY